MLTTQAQNTKMSKGYWFTISNINGDYYVQHWKYVLIARVVY